MPACSSVPPGRSRSCGFSPRRRPQRSPTPSVLPSPRSFEKSSADRSATTRIGREAGLVLFPETMCGIIGYVGTREAKPLLLQGLRRLEYRGYDSAGIALREDDGLDYVRAVGNLQNLVEAAGPNGSTPRHGVGHTRWATHGGVTEANAHPLTRCDAAKI